jgi:putative RNA 2'-phosphotransferase
MNEKDQKRASKFMSLVLRHQPDVAGLTLDDAGWASVDDLLEGLARKNRCLSRSELQQIVEFNDKKRFEFSEDGNQIRASQGHSVSVELGYEPQIPPPILLHGTVEKFLDSIREKGLIKGSRQHVHLHDDRQVAIQVGSRRGRPVILEVDAAAMASQGFEFFCSTNSVWLTDHVPPRFIRFPL